VGEVADHWVRMYDPEGEGWLAAGRALERIAAWSRARGVPVLVAIAPLLLPQDPAGTTTATFRAQVANAASANGLPCVDLQSVFQGVAPAAVMKAPDDIYHFNAVGHRVLAEALRPAVRKLLRR
jgi:lysophospholipase L1-like esterase